MAATVQVQLFEPGADDKTNLTIGCSFQRGNLIRSMVKAFSR
jgi:hypothetical protein